MIIEKNNVTYFVKETDSTWVLDTSIDGVDVKYTISKADCPSFEALNEFVAENDVI